ILKCGSGILASPVGFNGASGRNGVIANNRLAYIQNHPIRVEDGSDTFVHHNDIRNFAKWLSDDGVTFTDAGGPIPGIDIRSSNFAMVDHNIIRNDDGTPWASTAGAIPGKYPIGIRLTKLPGLNNITQFCKVDHNTV